MIFSFQFLVLTKNVHVIICTYVFHLSMPVIFHLADLKNMGLFTVIVKVSVYISAMAESKNDQTSH